MDLALRDGRRSETENQAVFLSAMDGIASTRASSRCSPQLLPRPDRPGVQAPGRLDVVLHFRRPTPACRGTHPALAPDIPGHLYWPRRWLRRTATAFAEVEELKNLLVMHFMDAGAGTGAGPGQFDVTATS